MNRIAFYVFVCSFALLNLFMIMILVYNLLLFAKMQVQQVVKSTNAGKKKKKKS